jgi:hypothetical protein
MRLYVALLAFLMFSSTVVHAELVSDRVIPIWVERFNNKGMSSKLYLKFLDVFISYIDMTVLYSFNGNLTVDFSKRSRGNSPDIIYTAGSATFIVRDNNCFKSFL